MRGQDKECRVKALTSQELAASFQSLQSDYDVLVPIHIHDGTRALAKPGDGPLALAGGAVPQKITNAFFPQMQRVLEIGKDDAADEGASRPILVVGLTAPDADALEFLDRFFSTEFRDDLYFSLRDGSVVVCVSGRCGRDGEFLKIAGSRCDLELICDGQKYLVVGYTDAGKNIAEKLIGGVEVDDSALSELQRESDALPTDDADLIQAAAAIVQKDLVTDDFWARIADRCIACTSCNLVCPTCSCFEVYDRVAETGTVERWRMWDSCQLDGFMREASGHNPMGDESIRTRRRIHHKLAADPARWDQITCMVCGRCDDVCPTGIGMKTVCREILAEYGNAK